MKTNSKIALMLFASHVLIVLLFGAAIYYFANKYSYIDFYKRLETRATIAARLSLYYDTLNADALKTLREEHLERLSKEREYIFTAGSEPELLAAASTYTLPAGFLQSVLNKGTATHKDGNVFYTGIRRIKEDKTYIVLVSAENYFVSHHLFFLRNVLLGGLLIIVLVIIGLSVYFSRTIFAPIRRITENVRHISTDSMHLRLKETEYSGEISELTATFNDLLNRIETAFEAQKNFVSNASHELGTPLTSIIGEADVALIKERTPEEYREAMHRILEQADRLDQITKSLLFLAQTGYSGKKIAFETLRADELIWEAKDMIDKLNPQNRIFVDSSLFPEDPRMLKVRGNRQLLRLALANLLNNACKYSHNKPVAVNLAAGQDHVVIIIKDQGVGIPENEIQFIYDPFFRASNTHFFEGYGIGLPLARNIVRLHNGTLDVTSVVNSGTTVQARIPLAG